MRHNWTARRTTGGALAAALASTALLAPGTSTAAESAPVPPRATAGQQPTGATLATGDRLEIAPGEGGSEAGFTVLPKPGEERPGRYAYTRQDGKLTLRPTGAGAALPATTVTTNAADAKKARAARAAGASGHKVTIVLKNAAADGPTVQVWNRKTWDYYTVESETYGSTSTVTLPPGDYLTVGMYNRRAVDPSYILATPFTVKNKALTVTADAKKAKETVLATDDKSAALKGSAVWMRMPNADVVGFMGGWGEKVYVTPFSLPGVSLRVHSVLTKKSSTANNPSPYRYDLFHSFDGAVPASPKKTWRKADLAKTVVNLRPAGGDSNSFLSSNRSVGDQAGAYVSAPVRLPSTVTEYATPGVALKHSLSSRDGIMLSGKERTPKKGDNPGIVLGAAPYANRPCPKTANSGLRDGVLTVYESCAFTDASGNPGMGLDAVQDLTLTANGTTLAEAKDHSLHKPWKADVAQPGQPHTLTRTIRLDGDPGRLSPIQTTAWGFTPSGADETPLTEVDLKVTGLSSRNTAGSAPVTVEAVASSRAAGESASVTGLAYSTDDGASWTELPPTGAGKNVSARLTVPKDARYVTLRADGRASDGATVRRTVVRAFGGPAPAADERVGPTRISQPTVNGGKPIVADNWDHPTRMFTVRYTVTDPAGVAAHGVRLHRGSYDRPDAILTPRSRTCVKKTATTHLCTAELSLNAHTELGRNDLTGDWKVSAWARSADGASHATRLQAGTARLLRSTEATVAGPVDKVEKGKKFTLTGTVKIDDWSTGKLIALPKAKVGLEFRKKGAETFTKVTTVTADASGKLKTTQKAVSDGDWRWVLPAPAGAAGDASWLKYVDVR